MQAITLEIILATVFGVRRRAPLSALREALRDFLDLTTDPAACCRCCALGPERIAAPRPSAAARPGRRADLPPRSRERRAPRTSRERDDILSLLVQPATRTAAR